MEWVRSQKSPWGQEILIGLSWELLWWAVAAGAALIAGHLAMYFWLLRKPHAGDGGAAGAGGDEKRGVKGLPARILRHTGYSRIFHWTTAISALTLLGTAFLPILGLKFPWVTIHWVAGLVLTAAIVFHIFHTTFGKGLRVMWITLEDLRSRWALARSLIGPKSPAPRKTGKNPLENKLFHHGVAVSTLATIVTGLAMLLKIDTPWWRRNPHVLSEDWWGIIYVVHGIGSVALITLVMVHLYFAARPEKWWITLSMLRGWITRDNYLGHYDPGLWAPAPPANQPQAGPKAAGGAASAKKGAGS